MLPEGRGGFGGGATTIDKFGWENLRAKGEKEAKNNQNNTDEAELKQEANRLILDDFFRCGDNFGKGAVHSSASGAETDAKKNAIAIVVYHRVRSTGVVEK